MRNPWDRPSNSQIPNRTGDRKKTPLFTSLGRALSAWEGVQVAIAILYKSLHDDSPINDNKFAEFDETLRVHERAKLIAIESAKFFDQNFSDPKLSSDSLKLNLEKTLAAYKGWAERRNELAHGYVTKARSPDYSLEDQPIITNYAILPSHARAKKWFNEEPEYNYVADEVKTFSQEFENLDKAIEKLATSISSMRAKLRQS
jgi:hypothetical protein